MGLREESATILRQGLVSTVFLVSCLRQQLHRKKQADAQASWHCCRTEHRGNSFTGKSLAAAEVQEIASTPNEDELVNDTINACANSSAAS